MSSSRSLIQAVGRMSCREDLATIILRLGGVALALVCVLTCLAPSPAQAQNVTLLPTISTIAGSGNAGGHGGDNGPATSAQFDAPKGVKVDRLGNVYIADWGNNLIRKVDAVTGIITTVAGTYTCCDTTRVGAAGIGGFSGDGGPAISAQLSSPSDIAVDSAGNIYIADSANSRIRRVDASTGVITTVAGGGTSGLGDGGPATSASLNYPSGVAMDKFDNLYIADYNSFLIRKVDHATGTITTVAGGASNPGCSGQIDPLGDGCPATETVLYLPNSVVVDNVGNLFIADTGFDVIRKVDTSGKISIFAGDLIGGWSGDGGPATSAQLRYPSYVAVDNAGNLYIADLENYSVRKVDAVSGIITTVAGDHMEPVAGESAAENYLAAYTEVLASAVAVDNSGNLLIADWWFDRIRKVSYGPPNFGSLPLHGSSTQGEVLSFNTGLTLSSITASGDFSVTSVTHFAATWPCSTGDLLVQGTWCVPQVKFQPSMPGNRWFPLVVTDSSSNKYSFGLQGVGVGSALAFTPGIISTVAGTYSCCGTNGYPTGGFSGDGGPAIQAQISGPGGVKMDSAGNLYFVDSGNYRVRKIDTSGNISTVAGSGTSSYSGDGGPAVQAGLSPSGLALDSAGNLYIAEYANNRVRKVDVNGNITSVAGGGSYGGNCTGHTNAYGDGCAATSAELDGPSGVFVDQAGNLYIAEQANALIRKVDLNGIISTVAGNGGVGFSGDGGLATSAELNNPTDVAVDVSGNLYIADYASYRVRKVDVTTGKISTVAGNGTMGNSSSYNGGPAINAELWNPSGLALDSAGDLYIVTSGRIWKVDPSGIINTVAGAENNAFKYGGDGGPATSAGFGTLSGVALDGAGNLYIADGYDNVIRKVDVTTSTLSFSSINALETSPAQSILVSNIGNAPLNFISLTDTSVPTNFVTETVGNDCVKGTPLAVGATCALGVSFRPTAPGNLNDTLKVGDDTFNSPHSVQLSGTASVPIASFYVQAGIATATGQAFYFDLTAKDSSNNPVTSYTGTVHFSSSDPAATLPADYTFTTADMGLHAFLVTLNTPGSQTVTVTDTSNTSLSATITRTLKGPIFGLFQQSNSKAGLPVLVEVFAEDGNGNAIPTYTGTVHFTSSDPLAVLPADYTFTAADAGTHANFMVTLDTMGNQTVTVTDKANPLMTGSVTVAVAQGQAATTMTVTTSPSSIVYDQSLTLTATVSAAFFDNASPTGNVTFTAEAPAKPFQTLGTVPWPGFTAVNNTTFQASITVSGSQFTGSTYNFFVTYSGDANYVSSSSNFTLSAATYGNAAILYANSGYLQSTPMQTAFPNPLTVLATDLYNNPVPGVTVTFSAPTSGPTATITSTTATTDSTGQASVTAVANALPGMYTVTASMGSSTANFTLMNVSGTPQSFGSVAVGSNTAETLWYPSYMGTTSVVFEYGMEFSAGTPSCTNNNPTFTNPALCNVAVTFQPKYPGLRTDVLILTDQSGNDPRRIVLTGTGTGSVVAFTPGVINTVAGNGTAGYRSSDDGGLATGAGLNYPAYVALDTAGNFYIADYNNALVRKVDTSGKITTVAGNGTYCPDSSTPCGDGYAATSANLRYPSSVAVDSMGNIYIADSADHRIRVMSTQTTEINVLGTVIQPGTIKTVAGNGTACTVSPCGDGNYAVWGQLNWPTGVALDGAGNLYIADFHDARVRKVNVSNSYQNYITTVAGNGTSCPTNTALCGDGGPATQAQLNGPDFVLVDSAGNLYITDTWDNRIRVVNTQSTAITVFGVTIQPGNIGTVAGTGNWGYRSTDEGVSATSAELNAPTGLAMDAAGNLYIADANNQLIRRVNPNGIITTIAGNGTVCDYSSNSCGDNGPATSAGLNGPNGVTVDSTGSLYIADRQNNRIRKVDVTTSVLNFGSLSEGQTSSAQSVTVTAVGNAPVNFTSLAASANFQSQNVGNEVPGSTNQWSDCVTGTPLAVGATCALGVAFAPTTAGNPLTGTITLTDDAFNSPQTVNLSGTATPTQVAPTVTFTGAPPNAAYQSTFTVAATSNASTTAVITASGACSIVGNSVTMTSAIGTCNLTANWAADANYTAASLNQAVIANQASTSTSVSISANPSVYGQVVTFLATVSTQASGAATPSGTVTFSMGSTVLGAVALDGTGHAAYAASLQVPGMYSITASYAGDANFSGGTSTVITEIVTKAVTATSVTASANPSVYGQDLVLTASVVAVAPSGGLPTGIVAFFDGSTSLNWGQLDTTGHARIFISSLSTGSHSITAGYIGDVNFNPSASATLSETINPNTQSITFALSPATVTYGVSPIALAATASSGLPVTFTVVSGPGQVSGNILTVTSAGTIIIEADQAGNSTYAAAPPVWRTLVVNPARLTVTANNATRQYGQANPTFTGTISGLVNGDNITATYSTTATISSPVGNYPIIPALVDPGGRLGNYAVTSNSGTLTIGAAASSTVVVSSLTPALYGQMITFTATVTDATSGSSGTPTGTVTFLDGGVAFGTSSLNPSGQTAYSTFALPGATNSHSITAAYSGDANFGSSTSSAILQTITAAPVVSLDPDAITFHSEDVNTSSAPIPVVLTNQGNATLTMAGIQITGGNNGDFFIVSNTCGSSLAALSSCTVSVVFSPRDTGTRTSSLSFADNNDGIANSNQLVSLTGSALSVVSASFSRPPIAAGSTIWFDSVLSAKTPRGPDGIQEMDLSNHTVNVYVTNGTITFSANNTTYNLPVPDAMITFTPTVSAATTTFDSVNNRWVTTVPAADLTRHMQQFDIPGEVFASGLAFAVPAGGLPGGITNVTWSAAFTTDTPGVTLRWEWGAAVYSNFTTNYNLLGVGVKSGDDGKGHCQWDGNGDRAGTPENFKQYLVMGATADDPGDYTGDFTRDVGVVPSVNVVSLTPIPVVFAAPQAANSTSSPMTVTITNLHQSMSVAIVNVAANGDFAVSALSSSCPTGTAGFTLAPGNSCTFNVTFAPTDLGTRTGQFIFTLGAIAGMNPDDVPPPQKVDLVGTGAGGTAPIAGLSQLSLNFGREENGTTSASQTVMLVNAGGAQLNITNIAIVQPSGDFTISSSTCVSLLAPAANCIVGVSFTPTAIGQRTGQLTFTYDNNNLSGLSQTVNLTGRGTP